MPRKGTCAFLIALLICTASCAVNPVTGRRELSLISEQGEIALGKETDVEIRNQYGLYDDPALCAYVHRVGESLVPHTHRPHLPYHFSILDTPIVNAFALPGGYIYLTRGILALMSSEAELAAVLGHELGHVNARHSVRKMSQLMLVQIGLSVGSALSETFAKISGIASLGIQLLFLKFSRDDERQADALGVEYARKGGYNPREMVRFFRSLEKLGDLSEGSSLPGFLSTHPLTSERIRLTEEMILEEDTRLEVRENPYLHSIADLVYGEDPRQGYVEGSAFYHPSLRFTFSFPAEWTLQNTPSKVSLASKDGRAAVILQAEIAQEPLDLMAKRKASEIEGCRLLAEQRTRINGMPAYEQLYEIPQEEGEPLGLGLSLIRKAKHTYTFMTLSRQADFSGYEAAFRSIINSFRGLKDPKYLNRKPRRIRLVRASGRETLRQIFQKAGMEEELFEKGAIMNGMELESKPRPGQLLKVVR
ncbi:MAG: M48 family metalloprotease [Candidatus Aminicenantales bacterium]